MRSPTDKIDGQITVAYDVDGTNWKLSVSDNGIGKPDGVFAQPKTGLGTGIVKALAQQLGAQVETLAEPRGHDRVDHSRHFLDEGSPSRVKVNRDHSQETHMDTTTLLIIIILVVLLGGGGWYGRGRWY